MNYLIIATLCISFTAFGDTQLVERVNMVVVADALNSGVNVGQDASVAVTLNATPGIIVNSQGVPGGQSDLSIRGSSFSGAGISISGLSLNSAQTEHFNAELPIVSGVLSAPVVLSGFDQVLHTEGHLVGTASFQIMPISDIRSFTAGVAEENGYWLNFLFQESTPVGNDNATFGAGLFGSYTEINAVDYDDNDLKSARGGGQLQYLDDESQWDFIAAYQKKEFGARGYYGVNPDWYADEETEDTLFLASWMTGDLEDSYIRSSIMRREQSDDYTLYWSFPGVYNNEHRTVTHSGVLGGRHYWNEILALDWRSSLENERMRSRSLGDHERYRGSGLLLPKVLVGKWSFSAGARYEFFEEDDSELLPQMAIDYAIHKNVAIRLSHSQSIRQPSYTELNYESPASLGNSGLENQKAETTELFVSGEVTKAVSWRLGLFQRYTYDTVDWIRETSESTRWTAENLGKADTGGIDCGLTYKDSSGSRISAHYSYLHKNSETDFYSSRYAFDYPEHYLLINALWQLNQYIGFEFTQSFRQQIDNPMRNSSDSAYNGNLAIHLVPVHNPHIQISLMVSNLWDDDYEYFPGQATISPRRISAGVTVDW